MNQSEVVKEVANIVGYSPETTKTVIDAFIKKVMHVLASGEEVLFKGFGRLYPTNLAARDFVSRTVDADTGKMVAERITKPERPTIRWKVSKAFREILEANAQAD